MTLLLRCARPSWSGRDRREATAAVDALVLDVEGTAARRRRIHPWFPPAGDENRPMHEAHILLSHF